ncbi:MAG: HPr family phosphocarrier protein [Rhodospirillales bacterium]
MSSGVIKETVICNPKGLHARPAAKVSRLVQTYQAEVSIKCNGEVAEASSIMDLLMLGADLGTRVTVCAEGPQANEVVEAVVDLINQGFEEI